MKTFVVLAAIAVALGIPVTAHAAALGMTHVSSPRVDKARGVAQAYRVLARSTMVVDRLNLFVDSRSTARKVQLGLYSGSAPSARERRARCMIFRPRRNAWNQCSFKPRTVTAGR